MKFKHIVTTVLVILLTVHTALAETVQTTAEPLVTTGVIAAQEEIAVRAPVSGLIKDFSIQPGDFIPKGAAPFTIETQKVYALQNGAIDTVFAKPGDDAAAICSRYGALMLIAGENPLYIATTTARAYGNEQRDVQAGEMVYVKSTSSSKYTGTGRITKVDGANIFVELLNGNLRFRETAVIYRSETYADSTRIGAGVVQRLASTPVPGVGTVAAVHVNAGQYVKKGDLLLELVPDSLPAFSPEALIVSQPEDGVAAQLKVAQGAYIQKDQTLYTYFPLSSFAAEVLVSEADIYHITLGDKATITFDAMDSAAMEGTVISIAQAPAQEINGLANYCVTLSFASQQTCLLGMHVTAAFSK